MSSSETDLAGEVERAWTAFRARLADRLAELEDDDSLHIEVETGVDEDQLDGAAPYLQFMGWGGDLVRAEVASNAFLDDRCRLGRAEQEQLVELGWLPPTYDPHDATDPGSPNFFVDVERRKADRLAVMVVGALRDAFGCAHPAFLDAEGLEIDPDAVPLVASAVEEADEPVAVFPDSQDELRELVDRALAVMFEEPLKRDGDGDVPIVAGRSVLYIRVLADRPAVELFAELVISVEDLDRAALEVAILNRRHPVAKFCLREDRVVLSYLIHTWPFAPAQLRVAVTHLCEGLDDLASDVAARVHGRRFLDHPPEPAPSHAASPEPDRHPSLVGLLELLYDGPAKPRVVAALYDNDRHAIIKQLVRLRTGVDLPGEHDLDLVLSQLRCALRFVADVGSATSGRRARPGRPPRSRQLSLLPDGEDTLDSGTWSHDLEESS